MDPRVTKIRFRGACDVEVHYLRASKIGGVESIAVRSVDTPNGAFLLAMLALRRHVIHMLELPQLYGEKTAVVEISIDHEHQHSFYAFTLERTLVGFENAAKIRTPKGQFTGEAREVLVEVERQALLYAQGSRAQLGLFEKTPEKRKPERVPRRDRGRRPYPSH